jgi:hypothetical protein
MQPDDGSRKAEAQSGSGGRATAIETDKSFDHTFAIAVGNARPAIADGEAGSVVGRMQ